MTVYPRVDAKDDSLLGLLFAKIKTVSAVIWMVLLRSLLTILGLTSVCIAAWLVAVPLGFLAIGVSLLVIEWAVKR